MPRDFPVSHQFLEMVQQSPQSLLQITRVRPHIVIANTNKSLGLGDCQKPLI